MKSNLTTIMKKELSRFFMDRKLLLTTVIMPGLMIYIIYSLMGGMFSNLFSTDEDYIYRINTVNMPAQMEAFFTAADVACTHIDARELASSKESITDGRLDLCITFPEGFEEAVSAYDVASGTAAPEIQLFYNSGETASLESYQVVSALLDAYENSMINKFDVNVTEDQYDPRTEQI